MENSLLTPAAPAATGRSGGRQRQQAQAWWASPPVTHTVNKFSGVLSISASKTETSVKKNKATPELVDLVTPASAAPTPASKSFSFATPGAAPVVEKGPGEERVAEQGADDCIEGKQSGKQRRKKLAGASTAEKEKKQSIPLHTPLQSPAAATTKVKTALKGKMHAALSAAVATKPTSCLAKEEGEHSVEAGPSAASKSKPAGADTGSPAQKRSKSAPAGRGRQDIAKVAVPKVSVDRSARPQRATAQLAAQRIKGNAPPADLFASRIQLTSFPAASESPATTKSTSHKRPPTSIVQPGAASSQLPSAQVTASSQLPNAQVTASTQLPNAQVTASSQLPSAQVTTSIPNAQVTASSQLPAASITELRASPMKSSRILHPRRASSTTYEVKALLPVPKQRAVARLASAGVSPRKSDVTLLTPPPNRMEEATKLLLEMSNSAEKLRPSRSGSGKPASVASHLDTLALVAASAEHKRIPALSSPPVATATEPAGPSVLLDRAPPSKGGKKKEAKMVAPAGEQPNGIGAKTSKKRQRVSEAPDPAPAGPATSPPVTQPTKKAKKAKKESAVPPVDDPLLQGGQSPPPATQPKGQSAKGKGKRAKEAGGAKLGAAGSTKAAGPLHQLSNSPWQPPVEWVSPSIEGDQGRAPTPTKSSKPGPGGPFPSAGLGGASPKLGSGGTLPSAGLGGASPKLGPGGALPSTGLGGASPELGPGGASPSSGLGGAASKSDPVDRSPKRPHTGGKPAQEKSKAAGEYAARLASLGLLPPPLEQAIQAEGSGHEEGKAGRSPLKKAKESRVADQQEVDRKRKKELVMSDAAGSGFHVRSKQGTPVGKKSLVSPSAVEEDVRAGLECGADEFLDISMAAEEGGPPLSDQDQDGQEDIQLVNAGVEGAADGAEDGGPPLLDNQEGQEDMMAMDADVGGAYEGAEDGGPPLSDYQDGQGDVLVMDAGVDGAEEGEPPLCHNEGGPEAVQVLDADVGGMPDGGPSHPSIDPMDMEDEAGSGEGEGEGVEGEEHVEGEQQDQHGDEEGLEEPDQAVRAQEQYEAHESERDQGHEGDKGHEGHELHEAEDDHGEHGRPEGQYDYGQHGRPEWHQGLEGQEQYEQYEKQKGHALSDQHAGNAHPLEGLRAKPQREIPLGPLDPLARPQPPSPPSPTGSCAFSNLAPPARTSTHSKGVYMLNSPQGNPNGSLYHRANSPGPHNSLDNFPVPSPRPCGPTGLLPPRQQQGPGQHPSSIMHSPLGSFPLPLPSAMDALHGHRYPYTAPRQDSLGGPPVLARDSLAGGPPFQQFNMTGSGSQGLGSQQPVMHRQGGVASRGRVGAANFLSPPPASGFRAGSADTFAALQARLAQSQSQSPYQHGIPDDEYDYPDDVGDDDEDSRGEETVRASPRTGRGMQSQEAKELARRPTHPSGLEATSPEGYQEKVPDVGCVPSPRTGRGMHSFGAKELARRPTHPSGLEAISPVGYKEEMPDVDCIPLTQADQHDGDFALQGAFNQEGSQQLDNEPKGNFALQGASNHRHPPPTTPPLVAADEHDGNFALQGAFKLESNDFAQGRLRPAGGLQPPPLTSSPLVAADKHDGDFALQGAFNQEGNDEPKGNFALEGAFDQESIQQLGGQSHVRTGFHSLQQQAHPSESRAPLSHLLHSRTLHADRVHPLAPASQLLHSSPMKSLQQQRQFAAGHSFSQAPLRAPSLKGGARLGAGGSLLVARALARQALSGRTLGGLGTRGGGATSARSRARAEEDDGWSNEQVQSLQKAYLRVDPEHPYFWQEVARRVPDKGACECFGKVHDRHRPPEERTQLRSYRRMGETDPDPAEVAASSPGRVVAKGQKPTLAAARKWAREQQLNAIATRARLGLLPQKNRDASSSQASHPELASAFKQKEQADRYISTFLRKAGGHSNWQRTCRQGQEKRSRGDLVPAIAGNVGSSAADGLEQEDEDVLLAACMAAGGPELANVFRSRSNKR
eukprot:gene22203-29264_t